MTEIDISKYIVCLEPVYVERRKVLVPESRSAATHVLRVVSPETTVVTVPDGEAVLYQADPYGYLHGVVSLCLGQEGLFLQLGNNHGLIPARYSCVREEGNSPIYFLVEDLVYSRPNGFFLKGHDHYSPSVHSPVECAFYVNMFDRLYSGLLGYAISAWQRDTPVLWDLFWKHQYFFDRTANELLFFDFDPFLCYPQKDSSYFAMRVASMLKNIVQDIELLCTISQSREPFPMIRAQIPVLGSVCNELQEDSGNEYLHMFFSKLSSLKL